jgi:polyisoprenoid-binding protein YceI
MASSMHTNEDMTFEKGAAQQVWTIDGARSKLVFGLRHIVVQRIEGHFLHWGGKLFVDRSDPALSSVEIWIDLGSITTGDAERDGHVRSSEFLDVARFPRARFSSDRVQVRGDEVVVNGRLDLHGVVHDVQVTVEVGASSTDPDGRQRARYTARATLDRQSFGLHWNQDLDVGGIVVGDEVEVRASVELIPADGAAATATAAQG